MEYYFCQFWKVYQKYFKWKENWETEKKFQLDWASGGWSNTEFQVDLIVNCLAETNLTCSLNFRLFSFFFKLLMNWPCNYLFLASKN